MQSDPLLRGNADFVTDKKDGCKMPSQLGRKEFITWEFFVTFTTKKEEGETLAHSMKCVNSPKTAPKTAHITFIRRYAFALTDESKSSNLG